MHGHPQAAVLHGIVAQDGRSQRGLDDRPGGGRRPGLSPARHPLVALHLDQERERRSKKAREVPWGSGSWQVRKCRRTATIFTGAHVPLGRPGLSTAAGPRESIRQGQAPVRPQRKVGVPGHLPEVAVGIGEVGCSHPSGPAGPGGAGRPRPGGRRPAPRPPRPGPDVVGQGDSPRRGSGARGGHAGVVAEGRQAPQSARTTGPRAKKAVLPTLAAKARQPRAS